MKTITLQKGRDASVKRKHPWVFSGAIAQVEAGINDGDTVKIQARDGSMLGIGHYTGGSLAVKVLSFHDEVIDSIWFKNKIGVANDFRKSLELPSTETNAYRLVHGEGDGLPGLIIDIYDKTAVVQPHSKGMEQALPMITEALLELGVTSVAHKPIGRGKTTVLHGEIDDRIRVNENNMVFNIDVLQGQKTGFFIDQRANRQLLHTLSKGKRVLNAFSYTGGFSVAAGLGGATEIVSLDASSQALDIAVENAALNNLSERHRVVKADAVKYLEAMPETYDIIVLDPPAFAKHKSARHNAIQAYRRINEAAIAKLNAGGILMTFSCSQVIDKQLFYDTIVSAGIKNPSDDLQVLYHLRQSVDHPVLLSHPEGEYLKGLVIRKM